MTSTYHILRTSKTAHLLGVAVGTWAGRVGSPAVIRTSDGAAMSHAGLRDRPQS